MKDRAYDIALKLKYDGYQRWLPSMVCKLFDKKKGWARVTSKTGVNINEVLHQELHKPVINKIQKKVNLCGS